MKTRIVLFIACLLFSPMIGYTQCEDFSKGLFELIKKQEFDQLEDYFLPIEAQIKIMNWPADSTAHANLKLIQNELKTSFIDSSQVMIESLANDGRAFTEATYLGCTQSDGMMPDINIQFTIDALVDSFSINVMQFPETDMLFVMLPLTYHSESAPIPNVSDSPIDKIDLLELQSINDEFDNAKTILLEQMKLDPEKVVVERESARKEKDGTIYVNFTVIEKGDSSIIEVNMRERTLKKWKP